MMDVDFNLLSFCSGESLQRRELKDVLMVINFYLSMMMVTSTSPITLSYGESSL